MRFKKTKVLRYIVATFLTLGTVLSVGFLSFSGLWIISPYIVPAILAFFLSGAIEGKIYGTSLFKGLARLKLLSYQAERHLFILELNKLISKKQTEAEKTGGNWIESQCEFLKDYWKQKNYYQSLKEDSDADEAKLQEAKKRLEELRDYFYLQAKKPNNNSLYISDGLKKASQHLLKLARLNVWFLRCFWIISILVGVVSGFVTAFAVHEAITVGLALSLSATALSAIVWPIALFAATGAIFLLYYAITEIVKNDAVEKSCAKVAELFKRKTNNDGLKESLSAYLMRCTALSFVILGIIGLTLFATAASGGTNWIIMRKGIVLLAPKLPNFVAYCANAVLIPISLTTDFIYGLSTTLQTVNNLRGLFAFLIGIIKQPVQKTRLFFLTIKSELKHIKSQETWGQFFNPFRIIAKCLKAPLQSAIFIGHLISIGLTTDRFLDVPPPLVATVCAVSEGLQDLSFITEDSGNDSAHNDHDHDHGNLLQLPLQVIFSPLLLIVGVFYWCYKKRYEASVKFFDAIKQTFELPLSNIVFFSILLLPSAVWHWAFSKKSATLSFFESIKRNFEIHDHEHQKSTASVSPPVLSEDWCEKERINWLLVSAGRRLNYVCLDKENAANKKGILAGLSKDEKIQEIVAFLKQEKVSTNEQIDKALEKFFQNANENKELDRNRIETVPVNGHSNGDINEKKKPVLSAAIILKQPRSLFFKNKHKEHKETTTSKSVVNAFKLVTVNAV